MSPPLAEPLGPLNLAGAPMATPGDLARRVRSRKLPWPPRDRLGSPAVEERDVVSDNGLLPKLGSLCPRERDRSGFPRDPPLDKGAVVRWFALKACQSLAASLGPPTLSLAGFP